MGVDFSLSLADAAARRCRKDPFIPAERTDPAEESRGSLFGWEGAAGLPAPLPFGGAEAAKGACLGAEAVEETCFLPFPFPPPLGGMHTTETWWLCVGRWGVEGPRSSTWNGAAHHPQTRTCIALWARHVRHCHHLDILVNGIIKRQGATSNVYNPNNKIRTRVG